VVIGTIFSAFMTTFVTINNIIQKGTIITKANSAAFSKMQEYENKSYANIPTTTPLNSLQQVEDFSTTLPTILPSPRSAKVYINTYSTTLKQVIVQVQYGSGASQQTLQYANFIQRNGVGR
jgi:hypothetical protein